MRIGFIRPRIPLGATLALAAIPLLLVGAAFTFSELGAARERERREQAATLTALMAESAERTLCSHGELSHDDLGSLVCRFAECGRRSLGIQYAMIVDRDGLILDHTDLGRVHTIAPPGPWQEAALRGISRSEKVAAAGSAPGTIEFAAPVFGENGPVSAAVMAIRPEAGAVTLADARPFMIPAAFMLLIIPVAFFIMRLSVRPLLATGEELRALLAAQRIPGLPALHGSEPAAMAAAMKDMMREFLRVFREQEEKHQALEIEARVHDFERRRLEAVLERVPEGLVLEGPDGRVEFMNRAAETLLGANRDAILRRGAPAESLMLPSPEDPAARRGLPEHLEVCAIPIHDTQHTLLGTVHLVRDLAANRHAEQAQHEFVTHLVHEVKNPLNTIRSYAEMLLDGEVADVETRKEFFNTINEEAGRLTRLVDNLMHLSRIEMGQMHLEKQFVKIQNLVEHAVGAVAPMARAKDLDLGVTTPDRLGSLSGDRQLLEVAIINILGNAVKYTPSGGRVTLQVEERPGQLRMTVSDTGPGIRAADRPRIFDKFFRSAAPEVAGQPGHGLGLSLTREIVELHGGAIQLESEPGHGATFTLTIPLDATVEAPLAEICAGAAVPAAVALES